jgi:2-hydroxychromene-2-carboxylate isomerase
LHTRGRIEFEQSRTKLGMNDQVDGIRKANCSCPSPESQRHEGPDMLVEFIFDYPSPYAYLASTQLGRLGVPVRHEPVGIVDVMSRVNNQPSPACPPKARYAGIDAARWARRYGVSFEPNRAFLATLGTGTFDYQILTRGALVAQELDLFAPYNAAMFAALWGKPQDIVTEGGRETFLKKLGIDAPYFWRRADSPQLRAELDRRNEAAAQRGVFGVPTFFVDNEMFFGNDRLDFVRERLAAHSEDIPA